MPLVDQVAAGCLLGEGIIWDGSRLLWTDIEARTLYSCEWPSQTLRRYSLPQRLGSFGLVQGCSLLIGAFEDGFALFDPDRGFAGSVLRPEGLTADLRLNDGRVDPQGRFWAGSMVEAAGAGSTASLYCVGEGRVRICQTGLGISNSLCWSPDGTRLYFADSARHVIWRYDYDPSSGAVAGRTVFAQTGENEFPDGAAVDCSGCVWVALWGAGAVVRYTPGGTIDRVLQLKVSLPTCVCFGGSDLDLLFVTSARAGLDDAALASQSGAGNVLVYNEGVRGLPEHRFDRNGWPSGCGTIAAGA